MSAVGGVLLALRRAGFTPRKSGSGWSCRCPSHDDQCASLTLAKGLDGRALIRCHAGCSIESVCSAIGLRPADLFNGQRRGDETPEKPLSGGGFGSVATVASRRRIYATAAEAMAELERRHGPRSAFWTYHNAAGEPAGLTYRHDAPDGGKVIRHAWRTADGSAWTLEGGPKPYPLWNLPALKAAAPGSVAWIFEGEKTATTGAALGLLTATSAGGSQCAKGSDWSGLAGLHVVISPDHDRPGERCAADVARLARAAGALSVRVVRLADRWPDLPEGGDLADLLEMVGDDAPARVELRRELEALADKTEPETESQDALTFRPFPLDALPEPVRGFVMNAAGTIGCDTSYVALPLLAAMASSIGTTRRVRLKRGWTEPAIVWTAIVGESGTAKSPAIEAALRFVRKRQHAALKRHAEAERAHAEALAVYERDLAQWKRSKSGGALPVKPVAPTAERCWTDDTTTEALAALLRENPRGLLVARDELAGWFAFDRYAAGKGGDAAKWLEVFGGRPLVVDRKSGGTLYVRQAAVSIAGGIQPETLRRALSQEHRDNGLAARLLFAMPPRHVRRWSETDLEPAIEAALAGIFERLYALAPDTDDAGDDQPRLLGLTDEAKRAWAAFYDEHNREQASLTGDEAAAWSKLEGYAARLALVIHLARWAAGDPALRDAGQVDSESIAAGVRLARWFGDEAQRVYALLAESPKDRAKRRLVEWIARHGGSVTARELSRGPREYRGDPGGALAALGELVGAGLGRWATDGPGPMGGRPADRFTLSAQPGDTGDGDETS